MRASRRALLWSAAFLVMLTGTVLAAELMVRAGVAIWPRPEQFASGLVHLYGVMDPTTGHAMLPNTTVTLEGHPDFTFEVESRPLPGAPAFGFRNRLAVMQQPANVWTVGDSFVWGVGVSQEDTVAAQLRPICGRHAWNLGVTGYTSPATQTGMVERAVQGAGAPPEVVWFTYPHNDLVDPHLFDRYQADHPQQPLLAVASRYTVTPGYPYNAPITAWVRTDEWLTAHVEVWRMVLRKVAGRLGMERRAVEAATLHVPRLVSIGADGCEQVAAPLSPEIWWLPPPRQRALCRRGLDALEHANTWLASHGTRLTVAVIPTAFELAQTAPDPTLLSAGVVAELRRRGLRVLDLAAALRSLPNGASWPHDAHWNPGAHHAVAATVCAALQDGAPAP